MKIFLYLTILYLIGYFGHALYLGKTVYGDGIYYYSWARSVLVDRDIDFQNDYELLGVTQQPTALGFPGNIYPVGPAVFWSPAFAWMHSLVGGDGVNFAYQLTVGLFGVFSAITGFILLYDLLRRFTSESVSKLTIIAIAFGTNLLFYGSIDTVNSHALSFMTATLFLTLWLHPRRNDLLLGAVLGCLALIRPQDALYGLLLLHKTNKRSLILNVIGFIGVFSIQLIAWQLLYGKFWVSPYLDRGYGFDFLRPKILEVLFSPNNGLFLWTPMALLGGIGLVLPGFPWLKRKWYLIGVALLQLYLVASWSTWWQGASFSGRMFISTLPILAIGLSRLFTILIRHQLKVRDLIFICIGPLCLINFVSIVLYLLLH